MRATQCRQLSASGHRYQIPEKTQSSDHYIAAGTALVVSIADFPATSDLLWPIAMINLSLAGLVLDLVGVMMLGIDLVRVQRRLRSSAEDRITRLDAILEEIGGIDGWAETVPSDFRDWQWEEGRTVGVPGTFNSEQARESFNEAVETIGTVGAHVVTLAKMQLAAIDADREIASLSLRYSYIGLALIFLGFWLQIVVYL